MNFRMKVQTFDQKLFILTLNHGSLKKRLLSVQWHKDGSVFIHFHMRDDVPGILAKVAHAPGKDQINLEEHTARVTKHGAKISFHTAQTEPERKPSRAHFSSSQKIRPDIFRLIPDFASYQGHLFTAHFGNMSLFQDVRVSDVDKGKNQKMIPIKLESAELQTLKVLGYQYQQKHFRKYGVGKREELFGPIVNFIDGPSAPKRLSFLLSNPLAPSWNVLMLAVDNIPMISNGRESLLVIGGFEQAPGHKPMEFLVMSYPLEPDRIDDLLKALGTVDLE